ncbi:hypothetical protein HPB47_017960 [Ixodes persulcatus]|uniref:Uncharacterized protein n=1 Tax=Ixodes persulcatus TaxID=34615 RepID=A0AC60QQH7_IXOPE|nr:hypothetical protein HPB47_017960 [Ixodes persulcatus]
MTTSRRRLRRSFRSLDASEVERTKRRKEQVRTAAVIHRLRTHFAIIPVRRHNMRWDADPACQALQRITTLFASTTPIHLLATHVVESGIRLSSVRNVVVIAVRVTEKAVETMFSAFCLKSFRSMYGTTELSNVISWMPRDTMEHKTIGFPAPDVQMKAVDIDTGKVLGPKEHGELWVKSPTNMRAYHNNPDATAEVITPDGWLRTGDIVYYDETGRFYIVERIKQFFHCMDRQVAQSEIEAVLLSHEGVEEAAVIDVPHPEYGDVAKAFVVLKPSYRGPWKTRTQELQHFVAGIIFIAVGLSAALAER